MLWPTGSCARLLLVAALCSHLPSGDTAKEPSWQTSAISGAISARRDARYSLASAGGKIFIFGGQTPQGELFTDVQVFDPDSRAWVDVSGSYSDLYGGTPKTAIFSDGKIYLLSNLAFGSGYGIFSYDPATLVATHLSPSITGSAPRSWPSAGVAFGGGKIYLFGGYNYAVWPNGIYVDSFFAFDVASLEWTDLTQVSGTLPEKRGEMGLAWVGTKLYMFGGQTFFEPSQSQSRVPVLKNDMYIYAANTGWAELSAGGTVPPPMQVNSMTAVGSKIYVPAQEVMYVFDPDTLAWSDLSPSVVGTPAAFSSFKAAWVGSRFFAFDAAFSSAQVFDAQRLTWSPIGQPDSPAPRPRAEIGMTAAGDKIYMFGGWTISNGNEIIQAPSGFVNSLYVFDPDQFVWTDLSSNVTGTPPSPRRFAGVTSIGRKVYVYGGFWEGFFLLDFFVFDPDTTPGSWTELTYAVEGSPGTRFGMGMTSAGGKLYMFGGHGGEDKFHVFDPDLMEWTDLAFTSPLPRARSNPGMAAAGGKVYLFGGSYGDRLNDFFVFDPETEHWTDLSALVSGTPPSAREWMGMTSDGGRLYIFGGRDGNAVDLDDLFVFDPDNMQWTEISGSVETRPQSRYAMGFAALGARLYVFGGAHLVAIQTPEPLGDIAVIPAKRVKTVSSFDTLATDLIFLYDGDTLMLETESPISFDGKIELCVDAYPCQLSMIGHGALVTLQPGAAFVCDAVNGCSHLSVESMRFECSSTFLDAPFRVLSGAGSRFVELTISGCNSQSNGGGVVLKGGSTGLVSSCVFLDGHSSIAGGAIFSDSSTLEISQSTFRRCSAARDGGAVVSTGPLHILDSTFEHCESAGEGGAVISFLGAALSVVGSTFDSCRSSAGGGAIASLGSLTVQSSTFTGCLSQGPGGAIRAYASDNRLAPQDVSVSVVGTRWTNCTSAQDGGAVSFRSGHAEISNSQFVADRKSVV